MGRGLQEGRGRRPAGHLGRRDPDLTARRPEAARLGRLLEALAAEHRRYAAEARGRLGRLDDASAVEAAGAADEAYRDRLGRLDAETAEARAALAAALGRPARAPLRSLARAAADGPLAASLAEAEAARAEALAVRADLLEALRRVAREAEAGLEGLSRARRTFQRFHPRPRRRGRGLDKKA